MNMYRKKNTCIERVRLSVDGEAMDLWRMCLWLVFSVIYFPISVLTISAGNADYDSYEGEEQETTPANEKATPPPKNVPKIVYPDIFQFYNTTEKIWVYNTTRKSNETCVVDDVEHTSHINVFTTRFSFIGGTIKNLTFEAKFDVSPMIPTVDNTYNEMYVRIPSVTYHYETLLFMSEKYDCGVFYNNYHGDGPGPYDSFDLRLWNSSLEKGPDEKCLHIFEEIIKSQPITFSYTSACQCIFRVQE
uniref:Lipocalin n=1 Tax=Rhipicephalus appendiculatus TaxID=34631 RepID=A0A131Z8R8_RHIAP